MGKQYDKFKEKAFSAFRGLAKDCPEFEDAQMLVGGSEATASLYRQDIYKSIDTEWIDAIERALPALDIIVRNPSVAIEDVDEVLPVELSRHITEKSIKHLAQHTNLILDVKKNGEVVPQKILNVYHDETLLTYENKFVNTLIARLSAFVDKRYRALKNGSGIERNYKFGYNTEFEHSLGDESGRNLARIQVNIELTSPLNDESESSWEIRDKYIQASRRVTRINQALTTYQSSEFAKALGRNFIRPPVVRTNAILKNKNLKECLTLWEYIESFDKVGYTVRANGEVEMPSDDYIGELYSSVALQYVNFYYGVVENKDVRLLSEKHLSNTDPQFDTEFPEEELEDYRVYDSEYKKTVPVSRLMNNRKKLSDDEKRIYRALAVALKADEILNAEMKETEKEMRRLAMQRRLEEEEKRRAEEAERARLAALWAQSPVSIRYRRSFLSRFIQADEVLQGYYEELKNQLLSYEGVKSRISWKADTFYKGRKTLVKTDIRGKRLYIYFAIQPKDLEGSKIRFTEVSESKPDTPVLIKIKGKLGFAQAKRLVDKLGESFALQKIEREKESYRMPYEDNEALIGKGLIKLVLPKGITFEDGLKLTKENLSAFFQNREADRKPPVVIQYRRSFLSRFIQADEVLQEYYGELKNTLLRLEGVKSRISWKADTFYKGRKTLVKMDIRGKRLYIYLAVSPKDLEGSKIRFADIGEKKPDTPVLIKIKGKLGFAQAKRALEKLAEVFALQRTERENENFKMPYQKDEVLVKKGLIKLVTPKGVTIEKGQKWVKGSVAHFFQALREQEAKQSEQAEQEEVAEIAEVTQIEEEVALATEEQTAEIAEVVETQTVKEIEEIEQAEEEGKPLPDLEALEGQDAQARYEGIKDFLFGYEGVKRATDKKGETFSVLQIPLVRLERKGKKLLVYLALKAEDMAEEKIAYESVKKYPDTPMLFKIKNGKEAFALYPIVAALLERYTLS